MVPRNWFLGGSLRAAPSILLAAVAGLAIGVCAARSADAQTPAVRHGQDLKPDMVGPRSIAAAVYPGATIKDGSSAPFLRRIETSATYDGFAVAGPHLLIEGAAFSGPLDIYAKRPLVLRNSSVRIDGASYWAVLSREGAGPLYFLWSDAGGTKTTDPGKPGVQRGLYLESANAVVYRSHISLTADGIQVHAPDARITETLIDELKTWEGEHNDGIQVIGRGERLTVQRSRIVNPHPQTSAILLQRGGHVIEDNYLSGGGWTVYGAATAKPPDIQPAKGVRISGNILGQERGAKSGSFGPIADWDGSAASSNVWRDNRFADGQPVVPAAPNR
jgi:hypothetical protein